MPASTEDKERLKRALFELADASEADPGFALYRIIELAVDVAQRTNYDVQLDDWDRQMVMSNLNLVSSLIRRSRVQQQLRTYW
jgi:hypothetical protein